MSDDSKSNTEPPLSLTSTPTPSIIDGDDLLARHEEESLAHLCPNAKSALQKRRRCTEELAVCEMLLRQWQVKHGMEANNEDSDDPTTAMLTEEEWADRRRTVLCYAAALEGLGRRRDAMDALRLCLGVGPEWLTEHQEIDQYPPTDRLDVPVALALAKLYFKDNRKQRAKTWCDKILCRLRECQVSSFRQETKGGLYCCSSEDASDAYHLAGWVRIHDDDHTGAYQLWAEGHEAVPECELLARQYRKRACWDTHDPAEICNPDLLGNGAHGDGVFRPDDLEAFHVPEENVSQTPALALFDSKTQKNSLVFRSRRHLMTAKECEGVLECVDTFHQDFRNGQWGTVRHSSVKTTDVAVEDIPALRPWLRDLLRTRIYPLVAAAYPQLADGSTTGDMGSRMRLHDAFIVRYDAEGDGSISLPEHSDTSAVSFTVALNSSSTPNDTINDDTTPDASFEGGGTWFEALGDANKSGMVVDANVGHAVAFAGPLRHAGYPVTKGCRVILVLFLYIEGFSYGRFLREHAEQHGTCRSDEEKKEDAKSDIIVAQDGTQRRPSGDMPGGFVVYNQTVELVSMLNRRVDSVLD